MAVSPPTIAIFDIFAPFTNPLVISLNRLSLVFCSATYDKKPIGVAPTQIVSLTFIAIQSIPTVSYLFISCAIIIFDPTPSVCNVIKLPPNSITPA